MTSCKVELSPKIHTFGLKSIIRLIISYPGLKPGVSQPVKKQGFSPKLRFINSFSEWT